MAKIFVSHSSKDGAIRDFFSTAFAVTSVQAIYEEIEAVLTGQRTAAQIRADITQSNAVFILLGENVEHLRHTRDWVAWESGVTAGAALQANKPTWVFETISESPRLSVAIPHLQHYVCFEPSDSWLVYIRSIISSYDDSHVLPMTAAGTGLGGAFGGGSGAFFGGLAGLLFAANLHTRPPGYPVICPQCRSSYQVHLAQPWMRCPVCNTRLQLRAG